MIELKNIIKMFSETVVAVNNISLKIEKGETLVLIGLSGCGKTTTLKMINRLIEPDSGDIFINNTNISKVDPITLRRNIGYVIQDIGWILSHRNVSFSIFHFWF